MKIKIKRFDKKLPLPERKSAGAVAFDLMARETIEIQPGTVGYVPLNIAVETPADHFLLLAARSSTHKRGLMMANGIGIVDPDFRGAGDEVKAAYYNFSGVAVIVEKGERIAQGTFVPIVALEWNEVEDFGNPDRGGFGSTGQR